MSPFAIVWWLSILVIIQYVSCLYCCTPYFYTSKWAPSLFAKQVLFETWLCIFPISLQQVPLMQFSCLLMCASHFEFGFNKWDNILIGRIGKIQIQRMVCMFQMEKDKMVGFENKKVEERSNVEYCLICL